MAEMKEVLATLGVAPERIHVEIFNGSESMTPGVVGAATRGPHAPKDDANTGPLVSFARSGIAAHWKASAYQSILELAEACDVPVRWSCRTGVCHSCESGLVSGAVVYGPEPLEEAGRRQPSRMLLTTDSATSSSICELGPGYGIPSHVRSKKSTSRTSTGPHLACG
jgi:ferredoxin